MAKRISSPVTALNQNIADTLLMVVEAEEMRRSLKQFVINAWRFVDPAPFVDGWCIDAICEHLTALSLGQIRFLLINIPPRHSKSTICSVLWPVWGWLQNPAERFLSASYSLDLSTRDNLKKRNLIDSQWFQDRYGQDFNLATDTQSLEFTRERDFSLSKEQNAKRFFMNNKLGYQMATSVASSATGHGGSVLLCLCYNVEVTTNIGRLYIGEVVEKELPVRVLAFDHKNNNVRWQRIDKYEVSTGRPCVRVTLNDGRVIDATTDHPFYVVGRGYVPAAQLTNTDKVITDESYLRGLRDRFQSTLHSCNTQQTSLLQSGMLCNMDAKRKAKHIVNNSLRGLWQGIQAQALRSEESRTPLLQQSLSEDIGKGHLRNLWQRNGEDSKRYSASRTSILQSNLSLRKNEQDDHSLRPKPNYEVHMRGLRGRVRTVNKSRSQAQASLLQSSMLWPGGTWREQSRLPRGQIRGYLRSLRKNLLRKEIALQARENGILLNRVSIETMERRAISALSRCIRQLSLLREADKDYQTQGREEELLFSGLCKFSTQRTYQWREQWEVCGWGSGKQSVSSRIPSSSSEYQGTRRPQMRSLPSNERRERQGARRSSYQLRHLSQRVFESGISLPLVSRKDARNGRAEIPVEALLVRCVEPIPTPEYVYNLRIAEDHNYFAQGILVHNCDDPHAADEAHSDVEREAANVWFRETWSNRMNDANKDKMLVVGQRIHEEDTPGIILKERPDWIHLNLPAEYESNRKCFTSIGWEDPRKEEGELLWPERFNPETLTRYKRDLGPIGYAAQYQQSPTPSSGAVFYRDSERLFTMNYDTFFLHTPKGIRAINKDQCSFFMTVDPAISEKQSADYMVIQKWAKTPYSDILLTDLVRGHWGHNEQQKEIEDIFNDDENIEFIAVETVAYQHALFQDLVLKGIPCKPFKPSADKVSRAGVAAIWQSNGKMYFLKDASWLEDFQNELYKFPKARKDDQVDATSLAAIVVRSRGPLSDDDGNYGEIPDPIEGPPDPHAEIVSFPITQPIMEDSAPIQVVIPVAKPVDAFSWADRKWGENW
jgi:predicted phage terminase large subunit-like protein